jgi:hypothetical protein
MPKRTAETCLIRHDLGLGKCLADVDAHARHEVGHLAAQETE